MVTTEAFAKINLSLEILGRRNDGYHELASVMQTVSLADTLDIVAADDVSLVVSGRMVPVANNLVMLAAQELRRVAGTDHGCHISLSKHIPVAAGLGGGSSDAAQTLQSLNSIWKLGATPGQLMSLGAGIGADVPFFLTGRTALVRGRGEQVNSLPDPAANVYVLVNPGFNVSTAAVFGALSQDDWSDGAETHAVAQQVRSEGRVRLGVNGLQSALFRLYPLARTCYEAVREISGAPTLVAGSGPTVVTVASNHRHAKLIQSSTRRHGWWSAIVTGPAEST
jgi:4-diphosphocytidyl-2-C-methyl-D-erythritol kinase